VEEAWEALQGAMEELMDETAGAKVVDAVEDAMQAAAKHEDRSEPLAALVAVARELVEQARAAGAERVRVAAEATAAAAAAAAAERLELEQALAALTLSVQSDALRVQSDRLRVQQMQARLCLQQPPRRTPKRRRCCARRAPNSSYSFTTAARCAARPSTRRWTRGR
jgi:hypothetical protein